MASKKRKTTTDATKAKLPLPKGHPQKRQAKRKPKRDDGFHPIGTPKFDAEKANRVTSKRCPSCRKLILLDPKDGDAMGVHTCYDAKALRAVQLNASGGTALQGFMPTPSPIAGQSLDGIGSAPLDVPRAIPCGEDIGLPMHGSMDPDGVTRLSILDANAEAAARAHIWFTNGRQAWCANPDCNECYPPVVRVPPPDTSAYPWPLKFAWWLDGWLARIAQRFA